MDLPLRSRHGRTVAGLRTDHPTFVARLPSGASWVEGPYRDLLTTGVLSDMDQVWAPLLFLRGLESVENGGTERVDGVLVRVLHGSIDHREAVEAASSDERIAMNETLNLPNWPPTFDADVRLDDQGRVRTLDFELDAGPPGADVDVPVELSLRVTRFDHEVERPDPPDPESTVPADEVPRAMDVIEGLGSSGGGADAGGEGSGGTTPATTAAPSLSTEYSDPEVAAEVLDRAPPDPEPPPADTPPDAVEVMTLIGGQGRGAAVGDSVVVHYVGVTADGQVVDSSWERGQPFAMPLGDGLVIAGWEEGLVGARIGERRHLVIGSDKAYGAAGSGDGSIPPDAPLAFDVDIIDVEPAGG